MMPSCMPDPMTEVVFLVCTLLKSKKKSDMAKEKKKK